MDYHEAEHLMRQIFKTRFTNFVQNGLTDADAPLGLSEKGSQITYIPKIEYRTVEDIDRTNTRRHWLRFISQNVNVFQASLTGGHNESVAARHTQRGLITIEIYISKVSYETRKVEKLKTMIQKSFLQQNTGSLWFRNPNIVNLESINNFHRSDLLVEYEYDFTL